jgi:hypothetical protein
MDSDSVTELEREKEQEMVMNLEKRAGSVSVKQQEMVTQLETLVDLDSRLDNSADDRDCTCWFAHRQR